MSIRPVAGNEPGLDHGTPVSAMTQPVVNVDRSEQVVICPPKRIETNRYTQEAFKNVYGHNKVPTGGRVTDMIPKKTEEVVDKNLHNAGHLTQILGNDMSFTIRITLLPDYYEFEISGIAGAKKYLPGLGKFLFEKVKESEWTEDNTMDTKVYFVCASPESSRFKIHGKLKSSYQFDKKKMLSHVLLGTKDKPATVGGELTFDHEAFPVSKWTWAKFEDNSIATITASNH